MYVLHGVIAAEVLLAILIAAEARAMPIQVWRGAQSDDEYQQLQELLYAWENSTSPTIPAESLKEKLLTKILEFALREPAASDPIHEPDPREVIRKKGADSDFIAKWRQQKQRMKLNQYRSRISQSLVNQIARM